MPKRKLRSDSAREKEEEDTRVLRSRSTKIVARGSQSQKRKALAKGPRLVQLPPNVPKESSQSTSIPLDVSPPPPPSGSQKSTIARILTVVSKSLSGLRLSQNSITLKQIAPDHQLYASAISRSPLLADKLLAFRTSGPSFSAIKNTLFPSEILEINALLLARWIVMRLFAFGHPDLIVALGTAETAKDVLAARAAYKKSSGLGVNSLPVYGNVRFDPKRVPGYVARIFVEGSKLFDAIDKAKTKGSGVILFADMMELIQNSGIPYHTSGTLFQWLLACDLAELGVIVAPPTARDLACRIKCCVKQKKGGSGVWGGLFKDIDEQEQPDITIDSLTRYLENIYSGIRAGLGTQEILFGQRGFWYSDLEHCLCKVIRATKY